MKVVYMCSPDAPSVSLIYPLVVQFAQLLPDRVRLQLFVSFEAAHFWEKEIDALWGNRVIHIWTLDSNALNYWIRDGGFADEDTNLEQLFISRWNLKQEQCELWKAISKKEGIPFKKSPFPLQGGNLITSEKTVYIGGDVLASAESLGYMTRKESKEWVHTIFDTRRRNVFVVEAPGPIYIDNLNEEKKRSLGYKFGSVQPLYHIDLFLRPVRVSEGVEVVFVGIISSSLSGVVSSYQRNCLDYIATDLASTGKKIARMPMPLREVDGCDPHYLSYLNVIIDNDTDTVFLPQYRDCDERYVEFDRSAVKLWEQFGYTVIQIFDLGKISAQLGGLRCATLCID